MIHSDWISVCPMTPPEPTAAPRALECNWCISQIPRLCVPFMEQEGGEKMQLGEVIIVCALQGYPGA